MIAALAGVGMVVAIATLFIASMRRPRAGKRDRSGDTYSTDGDGDGADGCDGGDGGD